MFFHSSLRHSCTKTSCVPQVRATLTMKFRNRLRCFTLITNENQYSILLLESSLQLPHMYVHLIFVQRQVASVKENAPGKCPAQVRPNLPYPSSRRSQSLREALRRHKLQRYKLAIRSGSVTTSEVYSGIRLRRAGNAKPQMEKPVAEIETGSTPSPSLPPARDNRRRRRRVDPAAKQIRTSCTH